MKLNGETKEMAGFVLMGSVGPIIGIFSGIRAYQFFVSENFPFGFGLRLTISVLVCLISAAILMYAGFVLITKKYNELYYSQRNYDQRMKGSRVRLTHPN